MKINPPFVILVMTCTLTLAPLPALMAKGSAVPPTREQQETYNGMLKEVRAAEAKLAQIRTNDKVLDDTKKMRAKDRKELLKEVLLMVAQMKPRLKKELVPSQLVVIDGKLDDLRAEATKLNTTQPD